MSFKASRPNRLAAQRAHSTSVCVAFLHGSSFARRFRPGIASVRLSVATGDFAHHARRHALLELVAVTCPSSRTLCLRYAAVAVRFYGRVISGMFPLRNPCTVHPYLSWAGGLALSSCRWARGRGGVCVGAQLEGRVWKFRGFGGRSCAFCPHEYFAITYGCSYGCARFAHGSRQGAHHDGMPGNVTREPPH
jgi:hypothetical protein